MARIEAEQHGDQGRVREWLARAVNAPRDPAWTADGIVSERWAPISPVTGALDAFQWRVPVEAMEKPDATLLNQKIEELVKLGNRPEPAIEQAPVIEASPRPSPAAGPAADAEIIEEVTRPEPPARKEPEPPAPEPAKTKAEAPKPAPTSAEAATEPAKPAPAKPAPEPVREGVAAKEKSLAGEGDTGPAVQPVGSPVKTYPQPFRSAPRAADPRIFVPPRAPDDPGPDDSGEDARPSAMSFQLPIKGSA
jgi:HemY protein